MEAPEQLVGHRQYVMDRTFERPFSVVGLVNRDLDWTCMQHLFWCFQRHERNRLSALRQQTNQEEGEEEQQQQLTHPSSSSSWQDVVVVVPAKEELILQYNRLGVRGTTALSQLVLRGNLSWLHKLELSNDAVGDEGAQAIAQALQDPARGCHLTHLTLSSTSIGNRGATHLAHALPHCPQLIYLNLQHNTIGNDGFEALGNALFVLPSRASNDTATSTLDLVLADNQISQLEGFVEAALRYQGDSSSLHHRLKSLDLSSNLLREGRVTDDDDDYGGGGFNRMDNDNDEESSELLRLGVALQRITSLEVLRLAGNVLGPRVAGLRCGRERLSQPLEKNHSLVQLDLSFCCIGDEGCQELRHALCDNNSTYTALSILNLHCNQIGPVGCQALAKLLLHPPPPSSSSNNNNSRSPPPPLKRLDLTRNLVGDQGMVILADALGTNQTLIHLNVNRNGIGNRGTNALMDSFCCCRHNTNPSSLRTIHLSKNKIGLESGEAWCRVLRQKARSVFILTLSDNNPPLPKDLLTRLDFYLHLNRLKFWRLLGGDGNNEYHLAESIWPQVLSVFLADPINNNSILLNMGYLSILSKPEWFS